MKAEKRFWKLDYQFWVLVKKPDKSLEEIGKMYGLVKDLKNNSYFRANRRWLNQMDRDERITLTNQKHKEIIGGKYE